jgi:hypothetical protein
MEVTAHGLTGWAPKARGGFGSDGFSAAGFDLRIPQIGTFFRPLNGEMDDSQL